MLFSYKGNLIYGIPGRDGKDGKDGADGKDGKNGTDGKDGKPGNPGATGPEGAIGPAGPGVPAGGKTGQIPEKKSDADYDLQWRDPPQSGVTMERVKTEIDSAITGAMKEAY